MWTAAVVVAIYSTLGLASTVADALRDRNLLRVSLAVALAAVLLPVAWRWVKTRPNWGEVGAVLGVAFVYWMVAIRIGSWEERTHLIEYGVVAALIHQALLERDLNGRRVLKPAVTAVAVTALLGLVDEGIQAVLPDRVFDARDIFFNGFAGFMVVAARLAIAPQSRPGWRVWFLWLWATAIGWGQGVYFGWYSDDEPKTLESTPDILVAGYLGLVAGTALIGVLQWLVLRRHVARVGWWVPATLAAAVASGVVIFGVGAIDEDLGWIVGVGAFGTLLGVLQWLVLRSELAGAAWWITASTIGWGLGMPFGDINGPPGLGAVYGAVTAIAMVWLLRQRHSLSVTQPL